VGLIAINAESSRRGCSRSEWLMVCAVLLQTVQVVGTWQVARVKAMWCRGFDSIDNKFPKTSWETNSVHKRHENRRGDREPIRAEGQGELRTVI
jgi:hypothetical protein